jgi:hypothetical protein
MARSLLGCNAATEITGTACPFRQIVPRTYDAADDRSDRSPVSELTIASPTT